MDKLERARKQAVNDVASAIDEYIEFIKAHLGKIRRGREITDYYGGAELKEYQAVAKYTLEQVTKRKWSVAESTPTLNKLWQEKAESVDDGGDGGSLVETILGELTDADIIEDLEMQLKDIEQDAGEDHGYRKELERQIEKAKKELAS